MSLPTIQNPFAPAQPTFEDEMCSMCPSMTYQQRLIGFCICCGCGYALSFMGTLNVTIERPLKKTSHELCHLYVWQLTRHAATGLSLTGHDGSARRCSPKLGHLPASSGY